MSAKEMFEELGYEQIRNDENFISYKNNKLVNYTITFVIRNDYGNKGCIELTPKIDKKSHYFTRLNMKLLKVINKQVEELGWILEE